MKRWMKPIYTGYRDIGVIGDVLSKWSAMDILPTMDMDNITRLDQDDYVAGVIGLKPVDLILMDLDAFGIEKARFLIFLTHCFSPQTPLVLITEKSLPEATRHSLCAGQVLGIIELKGSVGATVMTSA